MPSTAPPDVYEEAYELGYRGRPLSEKLKRAAEDDRAVFETWRAGRADREEDAARDEPTAPNTRSPSSSTSSSSGTSSTKAGQTKTPPEHVRARRAPLRRRRTAAGAVYRRTAAAVRPTTTELGHLLVLALLLVALYLVLTNVGALGGAIGLVQRSIAWLVSAV